MNNKNINPATGRAVNRYGLIGQQVLENRRAQCGGNKKNQLNVILTVNPLVK